MQELYAPKTATNIISFEKEPYIDYGVP